MADAKQGKTSLEDFYNGSQSRVVLAKPRLGGFGSSGFASSSNKPCNPFGSVLRPSQLKPGSNPFLKLTETPEAETDKEQEKESASSEDRLTENKEVKVEKAEEEPPKFVPLGSANVTPRTTNPVPAPAQPTSTSSSSGFVFGQNLSERVVINESVNNGDVASDPDHSSTNGTTELLFTAAAQATVKENNQEEVSNEAPSSESPVGLGLAAAAAEYERSHRPPPVAATTHFNTTGEEGEINVLQMSCRLFAWESGTWRERGRSVLRLNDARDQSGDGEAGAGTTGSRLVIRAVGSLRVVVNTPLWRGMAAQRAGQQALRLTAATDHAQVKLFLVMGASGDINQLYRALTSRIAVSKDCAQNSTSQQAAERLEAATSAADFEKADADDKTDADETDSQEQKTDETSDQIDEAKPLKRKDPTDNDTPPKRQCPDVLTD